MEIKPEHLEQLELEVQHIFDSGANEVRVYNMVQAFIESRGKALFIDGVRKSVNCDHPRSERTYIGKGLLKCGDCGKEFS